MLRKGHGLYKAPAKEERRKRKAKRRERDQIKFIDLGLEREKVIGLSGLWPIQSPSKGRKKIAKGLEEREIRSSLLILDFKEGKL